MSQTPQIVERQIEFDPAADFEKFLAAVPARWVVYRMADADARPIQLLCVKIFAIASNGV